MTAVIQIEKLTKTYGSHRGIVDIRPPGRGGRGVWIPWAERSGQDHDHPDAARHIRPTAGRALVFGIETTVDPVAHTAASDTCREFSLYDKLTAADVDYFANLRGGVDRLYSGTWSPARTSIRRGGSASTPRATKQKSGCHRLAAPTTELLLLDEPTSGSIRSSSSVLRGHPRGEGGGSNGIPLIAHPVPRSRRHAPRVAIIATVSTARLDRTESLRDLAHHQVELVFTDTVRLTSSARCRAFPRSSPTTMSSACGSLGASPSGYARQPATTWRLHQP